jgi:hypothetical protein
MVTAIVMSNSQAKMSTRKQPLTSTEQGVALLSSVLCSTREIATNAAIMRAFVRMLVYGARLQRA